jgi:hypothetical protein
MFYLFVVNTIAIPNLAAAVNCGEFNCMYYRNDFTIKCQTSKKKLGGGGVPRFRSGPGGDFFFWGGGTPIPPFLWPCMITDIFRF